MTQISLRSVRYAFILFLLALTTFAVVESAVGGNAPRVATGLSECGTIEQPCLLQAVAVSVPARAPAPAPLAADEGLAACGSEARPCVLETVEVNAGASAGRLASVERAVGMTLRVRS
jgi:hypothetical protein